VQSLDEVAGAQRTRTLRIGGAAPCSSRRASRLGLLAEGDAQRRSGRRHVIALAGRGVAGGVDSVAPSARMIVPERGAITNL
jgi:hypothetical protein